jgi:hypothetical protein
MVGHHRSGQGGAPFNAVRASGLRLCTIEVSCYTLSRATLDNSLNSEN